MQLTRLQWHVYSTVPLLFYCAWLGILAPFTGFPCFTYPSHPQSNLASPQLFNCCVIWHNSWRETAVLRWRAHTVKLVCLLIPTFYLTIIVHWIVCRIDSSSYSQLTQTFQKQIHVNQYYSECWFKYTICQFTMFDEIPCITKIIFMRISFKIFLCKYNVLGIGSFG